MRRRSTYRLSTLLLLVTIASAACAGVANTVQRAAGQRAATNRVHDLGGRVFCLHDQTEDGRLRGFAEPPAPRWLRDIVGDELFQTVDIVDISRPNVGDSDLDLLQNVSTLTTLILNDSQVTDAAIDRIAVLPQLKYLSIFNTNVTSAGRARLRQLRPDVDICFMQFGHMTGPMWYWYRSEAEAQDLRDSLL